MIVDGGVGDAGALGDIADTGAGEALLGEEPKGGVQDLLSGERAPPRFAPGRARTVPRAPTIWPSCCGNQGLTLACTPSGEHTFPWHKPSLRWPVVSMNVGGGTLDPRLWEESQRTAQGSTRRGPPVQVRGVALPHSTLRTRSEPLREPPSYVPGYEGGREGPGDQPS